MGNFEKAHEFTSRWEGGYVNHAADPGGATNFGISLRFLKSQGLDIGDIATATLIPTTSAGSPPRMRPPS